MECERRSIEAEWPMEQQEVGRLGALPAAAAALPRAPVVCGVWCAFAGSIISRVDCRLFVWLPYRVLNSTLLVPCQSWWYMCCALYCL